MAVLTIDGREVEVPPGTTILSAARKLGIDLPVFCFHDGLSVAANCRMCLVEVAGADKPLASCEAVVSDGMEVFTQSALAREARKGTLQVVLRNHPVDCPICDSAGECALQDHYFEHGAEPSRSSVSKTHKEKRIPLGKNVILDRERCLECTRCVRFCREVSKSGQLIQLQRDDGTEIGLLPGQEFNDPYSLCTVDVCPVGALTGRDFRFKKRVWRLKQTPSVCPECARGCAINVDHEGNTIYRLRPRYEPRINKWWACDEGRLAYPRYATDRIIRGRVGIRTGKERTLPPREAALAGAGWLHEVVAKGGRVAVLVDGSLSIEEGFAALSFARHFATTEQIHLGLRTDGLGDDLLRRPQRAANATGLLAMARSMGFAVVPAADLFERAQKWAALVGFGAEIELPRPNHPEQVGSVLLFAWRHNQVTRVAHTLVPLPSHYEKAGHYVNFEHVVQASLAALEPPAHVVPLPSLLLQMAAQHAITLDYRSLSELSQKALAALAKEGETHA